MELQRIQVLAVIYVGSGCGCDWEHCVRKILIADLHGETKRTYDSCVIRKRVWKGIKRVRMIPEWVEKGCGRESKGVNDSHHDLKRM